MAELHCGLQKQEISWRLLLAFDQPTENMKTAPPLQYQSGYITTKDYDRKSEEYILSIPKQEVWIGYTRGLMELYN